MSLNQIRNKEIEKSFVFKTLILDLISLRDFGLSLGIDFAVIFRPFSEAKTIEKKTFNFHQNIFQRTKSQM